MITQFVNSKSIITTGLLLTLVIFDINKPGYLTFVDPLSALGFDDWGECPKEKIAYFANIEAWQKGLSEPSTVDLWKQRLGEPICSSKGFNFWKLPGLNVFLKLYINDQGAITAYEFYK